MGYDMLSNLFTQVICFSSADKKNSGLGIRAVALKLTYVNPYQLLSGFCSKKYGCAPEPVPNPYHTRNLPVHPRNFQLHTSGFLQNIGFSKPVPNPYRTRNLPVHPRNIIMGMDPPPERLFWAT